MSQPHGFNFGWLLNLLPIVMAIIEELKKLRPQATADCGCGEMVYTRAQSFGGESNAILHRAQAINPDCLGRALLKALPQLLDCLRARDLMCFLRSAPPILAEFFQCQYGTSPATAHAAATDCVMRLVTCLMAGKGGWVCALEFLGCLLEPADPGTPQPPTGPGTPTDPPAQGGYHGPVTRRC